MRSLTKGQTNVCTYVRTYVGTCMCMHTFFCIYISVSRSEVYSITSAGDSNLSSDKIQCHPDRNLISNQNVVYFELFLLCFCTYMYVPV